jgi:heme exporter protein CcmD
MMATSFLESPYIGYILASYAVVVMTCGSLAVQIMWKRQNLRKALQQLDDTSNRDKNA